MGGPTVRDHRRARLGRWDRDQGLGVPDQAGDAGSGVAQHHGGGRERRRGRRLGEARLAVEPLHGQHPVRVGAGGVVAQQRLAHPGPRVEAGVARAERHSHGERRVVDVVGCPDSVAVSVHADDGPGAREDLQRSHGAVPGPVAVEPSAVTVTHGRPAVPAVERWPDEGGHGHAVLPQVRRADRAVVGLDLPDRGQQGPLEAAARARLGQHRGRSLVGRQRGGRDRGVGRHAGPREPREACGPDDEGSGDPGGAGGCAIGAQAGAVLGRGRILEGEQADRRDADEPQADHGSGYDGERAEHRPLPEAELSIPTASCPRWHASSVPRRPSGRPPTLVVDAAGSSVSGQRPRMFWRAPFMLVGTGPLGSGMFERLASSAFSRASTSVIWAGLMLRPSFVT